jgi:hypothetical protein
VRCASQLDQQRDRLKIASSTQPRRRTHGLRALAMTDAGSALAHAQRGEEVNRADRARTETSEISTTAIAAIGIVLMES